jgi:hypothetical protein
MLDSRSSTVERAYELAKSGRFRTVGEIKIRVRAEGYYDAVAQLEGRTISAALRRLIVQALADAGDAADPG